MADDENKKAGQKSQSANKTGNAQNVGRSSNVKKRRKRRPRKRKPANNNANISNQMQDIAGTPTDHGLTAEPLGNKPVQNTKSQNAAKPVLQDDEGGFNLSHIEDNSSEEEVPVLEDEFSLEDEAPIEESEPEEPTPEPEVQQDQSDAPVGWDQLKEAIKKDHTETEQKMEQQLKPDGDIPPEVIPAAVSSGAAIGAAEEAKKEEPIAPEEVEVVSHPTLSEDELEKKEVIQIITRYALGGCAVIAIVSMIFFFRLPQMVFGGIVGLFSGGDTQTEEVVQDDQTQDNQTQTDKTKELESTFVAGDNQGTSRDKFEEGVETALVTGDGSPTYEGAPDAIKTLYLTGLEVTSPKYTDRIGSHMEVLLKLQNAFATDIHQLLDNSRDREEALDVHLRELREIYQDSVDTQREVNEEKDRLKVQFNEVTTQKERLEKDFFVSLDKLEGNKSNDLLNSFIEVSKRQIELKAEYNALNKASKLFDIALANMDARIKDIEFNRNALIKGVQVVDIKGSDLDLIIQEGDLF